MTGFVLVLFLITSWLASGSDALCTLQLNDKDYDEGDSVYLYCKLYKNCSWKRRGGSINIDGRYKYLNIDREATDCSIVVSNITKSIDVGQWICEETVKDHVELPIDDRNYQMCQIEYHLKNPSKHLFESKSINDTDSEIDYSAVNETVMNRGQCEDDGKINWQSKKFMLIIGGWTLVIVIATIAATLFGIKYLCCKSKQPKLTMSENKNNETNNKIGKDQYYMLKDCYKA